MMTLSAPVRVMPKPQAFVVSRQIDGLMPESSEVSLNSSMMRWRSPLFTQPSMRCVAKR